MKLSYIRAQIAKWRKQIDMKGGDTNGRFDQAHPSVQARAQRALKHWELALDRVAAAIERRRSKRQPATMKAAA